MMCTVTAVRGLMAVPSITWTGPDGNLTHVENITVGPAQTLGFVTSRSLTLHHLQSPEGGQYSCNAAISVPGFETSPQTSTYKQLVVISTFIGWLLLLIIKVKFCRYTCSIVFYHQVRHSFSSSLDQCSTVRAGENTVV